MSPGVQSSRPRTLLPGLALAVVGSVLFSGKAIVVKLAYRYNVDPLTLIALRMGFAAPFFVVSYWWASRGAQPISGRDHGRLIALGVLGYYLASYLDFLGLQHVSAALERLILFLNPTIVLLLSAFFLAKRIRRPEWIALALSYAGIVLAFWHDVRFEGGRIALGSLLVFGSALCYALYLVIGGELVKRLGAIRLTSYAMCVSSVAVMLHFLLASPVSSLAQPAPVYWPEPVYAPPPVVVVPRPSIIRPPVYAPPRVVYLPPRNAHWPAHPHRRFEHDRGPGGRADRHQGPHAGRPGHPQRGGRWQ